MTPAERFYIDRDDSGHRYVVPWEKHAEWDAFLSLPEDELCDAPDWAIRIDGGVLTFENWRIEP